jgi:hypothetical protein
VLATIAIWALASRFTDVSNRWVDIAVDAAIVVLSAVLTSWVALLIGHGPTFVVDIEHQNVLLQGRAGPIEIRRDQASVFLVVHVRYWRPWLGTRLSAKMFSKPLQLRVRFTPSGALTRCLIDLNVRGAKARPLEGKSGLVFTIPSDPRGGEVSALKLEVAPDLHQGMLDLAIWAELGDSGLSKWDRRRVKVRSSVSSISFTLHQ